MEFPVEVWQLVLSHFDAKSLKKCLLWSENFREVIIETPILMKKLSVIFSRTDWQRELKFVSIYGKHVKSVKFDDCCLQSAEKIKDVLRKTPNVEEIIFNEAVEQSYDDENFDLNIEKNVEDDENDDVMKEISGNNKLLSLPKLKSLEIRNEAQTLGKLIQIFISSSTTTLEHFSLDVLQIGGDLAFLSSFIMKQRQLVSFFINGEDGRSLDYDSTNYLKSIFTEDLLRHSLKLKKLSMKYKVQYFQEFATFILQQSKHLEEIELISYEIDFFIFRLIINNCHRLKKLSLKIENLLDDSRIEELSGIEMPSVTELKIIVSSSSFDQCKDVSILRAIVGMFPNLVVLDLPSASIRGVLELLPKLEKLSLYDINPESLVLSKNGSLKILELTKPHQVIDSFIWEEIAKNFPIIKELKIRNFESRLPKSLKKEVENLLKALKYFKNLQSAEIVNEESSWIRVSDDGGVRARQSTSPAFKFIMKSKVNGGKSLKVSNYFLHEHIDTIASLRIPDVDLLQE